VPLTPAGAIAGRLFDADCKPYKGTDANIVVNYHWVSKTPAGVSFTDGGSLDANDARVDLQGLFLISPLPLGRTYAVTINCGHTLCHTKPIELSGVKPTVEVTLALPRTMAIEGRVLDSKGQPLVVPWELDCSWDGINGKSGNGWGGITDAQGRFRIDNVGIGAGEYAWYFKPRRNFQPYRVPVPLDGKPIEVRLKSGHVLEGTIIDDATDKPVAGVEITAMPAKLTPESMSCEAESTTDARGRFRFSNLGDQPYKMWLCGPQIVRPDPRDEPTWRPGEKDVVLRVIIPDDYRPPE